MTRITFYFGDGVALGYEVSGHAGKAESGHDIVCAAISSLTTTGANALESVAGVVPEVQVRDGYMRVMTPTGAKRECDIILRTVRQGLCDLAEAYPRYVCITDACVPLKTE